MQVHQLGPLSAQLAWPTSKYCLRERLGAGTPVGWASRTLNCGTIWMELTSPICYCSSESTDWIVRCTWATSKIRHRFVHPRVSGTSTQAIPHRSWNSWLHSGRTATRTVGRRFSSVRRRLTAAARWPGPGSARRGLPPGLEPLHRVLADGRVHGWVDIPEALTRAGLPAVMDLDWLHLLTGWFTRPGWQPAADGGPARLVGPPVRSEPGRTEPWISRRTPPSSLRSSQSSPHTGRWWSANVPPLRAARTAR